MNFIYNGKKGLCQESTSMSIQNASHFGELLWAAFHASLWSASARKWLYIAAKGGLYMAAYPVKLSLFALQFYQ